jgi:hypothetical protein
MREPCAVKVASTVLRGAGGRKVTCLPDILSAIGGGLGIRVVSGLYDGRDYCR